MKLDMGTDYKYVHKFFYEMQSVMSEIAKYFEEVNDVEFKKNT